MYVYKPVNSRILSLDRINCLNANRFTIYRTKCIDIVTLKVLPTSYNSEERKSTKFTNPKMKQNKIDRSFLVQVL